MGITEYTPKPWSIDDGLKTKIVVHRKGLTICHVCKRNPDATGNARLIAAAPELLAALEDATSKISQMADFFEIDEDDMIEELEEVIARARGVQT